MNIVVLDGYALNPGDLSWKSLDALGNVTYYNHCNFADIVPRLADADVAIVNKVLMTKEIIEQLPKLKAITLTATGYNNVAIAQATKQGITVHNVPAYITDSVVQLIFSFILHFSRQVVLHNESVQNGRWESSETFCYWDTPQIELAGKKLGIVGFGNIGQATALIAQAFGMDVLVATRTQREFAGVSFVSKRELFEQSDFISLACALTSETENLINDETLTLMKKSAYLINTGRGPLVDEVALAAALKKGALAGAAVDVLRAEPPRDGSVLIGAQNCLVTPHIGWATLEARQRCMAITVETIMGIFTENLVNQVTL